MKETTRKRVRHATLEIDGGASAQVSNARAYASGLSVVFTVVGTLSLGLPLSFSLPLPLVLDSPFWKESSSCVPYADRSIGCVELAGACVWGQVGHAARHSTPVSGGTRVYSTSTQRH